MPGRVRSKKKGSRLMETQTGDGLLVHWMPKEKAEWECPVCGRWFLKVEGKWAEPWVA